MSNSQRFAKDDPALLVARFLLSSGYLDTLQAFSDESNISISDFSLDQEDGEQVTLESLLEERRLREVSIALNKARLVDLEIKGWTEKCPEIGTPLVLKSLSNVLFVNVERVLGSWSIIITTADKALRIYSYNDLKLQAEYPVLHTSPILEARVLHEHWLLTAGMDGQVIVTDLLSGDLKMALTPGHTRYVNRLVIHNERWIATSGYDKVINMYEITNCSDTDITIEHRCARSFQTLPEGLLFVELEGKLMLVVTARDTCFLEYYDVASLELQNRVNMNENKDLWVSFSGIDISQQPTGPRMIGLSTSTTPYGRWLAFEVGKEGLQSNIFHGAPQSDLGVLPRHVWRPDGSGFWGKLCGTCIIMMILSDII